MSRIRHPQFFRLVRIIGRDREIERVAEFLADGSGARCLALWGEPGVGKTTLWRHGVDAARTRGLTLLLCRPLELDMQVPFAGLRDLLGGVLDEVLAALPGPQRSALGAALRIADPPGGPPEPSAIAFALHSGLEAVARRAPMLIGIDDVQWLDQPSAGALRFALRRLGNVAVRLLAAQRAQGPGSGPLDLDRVFEAESYQSIALGGLPPKSIQHILSEQLAVALPRPLLLKVHSSSGGNPFFALELVRALERHGGTVAPGRGLPVPTARSRRNLSSPSTPSSRRSPASTASSTSAQEPSSRVTSPNASPRIPAAPDRADHFCVRMMGPRR